LTTRQDSFIHYQEDDARQVWLDNGFMDRNPFKHSFLMMRLGGGGNVVVNVCSLPLFRFLASLSLTCIVMFHAHHEHILVLCLKTDFRPVSLIGLRVITTHLEESLEALSVHLRFLHNFISHFTEAHFDPLVNTLQVTGLFLSSGATFGVPHTGRAQSSSPVSGRTVPIVSYLSSS